MQNVKKLCIVKKVIPRDVNDWLANEISVIMMWDLNIFFHNFNTIYYNFFVFGSQGWILLCSWPNSPSKLLLFIVLIIIIIVILWINKCWSSINRFWIIITIILGLQLGETKTEFRSCCCWCYLYQILLLLRVSHYWAEHMC